VAGVAPFRGVPPRTGADPAALRKAVYKAEAVVLPRKVPVTREFLDFAPRLRAVARMHVGTDNTDLEACRDRKMRVIQASTATVRSNAEYLLASLLLLYRRGIGSALIGDRHADIRMGREINGSVVGILGLAPAAHALALMLHFAGRAPDRLRPCRSPHRTDLAAPGRAAGEPV
jgi:phosphoglycerate dehydrogenase-like enzyme